MSDDVKYDKSEGINQTKYTQFLEKYKINTESRFDKEIQEKYSYKNYKNDKRQVTQNNYHYIPPELMTEDEVEIWIRCKVDPLFFIENFIFIQVKEVDNDRHPFGEFIQPKQRQYVELLYKFGRLIVKKTRQVGFSTVTLQFYQWMLLFNKEIKQGIIQHKSSLQTEHIHKTFKTYLRYIPPFLLKPVVTNNKQEVEFLDTETQTSKIRQEAPGSNSEPFSGETMDWVMIDETQKVPFIDDHMQSIKPTLQTQLTKSYVERLKYPQGYVMISTPKKQVGRGKFFYNEYISTVTEFNSMDVFNDTISMLPFTQLWHEMGKSREWYENQKKILKKDWLIAQELDGKFVSDDNSYFEKSKTMKLDIKRPVEERKIELDVIDKITYLNIYEEPIENNQYIIQVDIQEKDGTDFSQIEIIDQYSGQEVQYWVDSISTYQLQHLTDFLGRFYNNQTVQVELNKGFTVIEILRDILRYPNMFLDENKKDNGIRIKASNRKRIIDEIDLILDDYDSKDKPLIKSFQLIEQISSYVEKRGRPDHLTGGHDDVLFAYQMQLYQRSVKMGSIIKHQQNKFKDLDQFKEIEQAKNDVFRSMSKMFFNKKG